MCGTALKRSLPKRKTLQKIVESFPNKCYDSANNLRNVMRTTYTVLKDSSQLIETANAAGINVPEYEEDRVGRNSGGK